MIKHLIGAACLCAALGCQPNTQYRSELKDPELYQSVVKNLTDINVYDIFSPPVASRVYAYPNIAAYEVMAAGSNEFVSLSGQLSGLSAAPLPDTTSELNYEIASLAAFNKVGKALIFSEDKMVDFEKNLWNKVDELGTPSDVLKTSRDYGEEVANHILALAEKDNYNQTRTFPKYTIQQDADAWKPTPPDYMEGIEPHWNKIRNFCD